jgi:hypothetical protein
MHRNVGKAASTAAGWSRFTHPMDDYQSGYKKSYRGPSSDSGGGSTRRRWPNTLQLLRLAYVLQGTHTRTSDFLAH